MNDVAVSLDNVSKYYRLYNSPRDRLKEALHPFRPKLHREFYALSNVSIEVKKGEILGIVGRNGSGKSTLLRVVASIVPANSGILTTRGRISTLLDLGAGMNPDMSGVQNLFFGGLMQGLSHREMADRIGDIVAFADIGEFINQPVRSYSSGMRARLGFALAVHVTPEILLVDEVLAVGDDLFRRKCFSRMETMLASGCTVFFVSHSASAVNELCTRAILLDRGELVLDGPPKQVTAQYQRLLLAPAGLAERVRQELVATNRSPEWSGQRRGPRLDAPGDPAAAPGTTPPAMGGSDDASPPIFIPELVPLSTVVTRNADVDVTDIVLRTPSGAQVNVLELDGEYVLSHRVRFGGPAENVSFSMAIKTERGLVLSWATTPHDDSRLRSVAPGETLQVAWRFRCSFMPGVYFTNIAVRETRRGETTLLHRVVDASVFKTVKPRTDRSGGYVSLGQSATVTRLE